MKYTVKNETEWHALRSKHITASEAAVLIGMNPYSSPSKLKSIDDVFVGNANTIVGQVLEPVVVDIVNRIKGSKFCLYEEQPGEKVFFTRGNLGATPDAVHGSELLECKTTRPDIFLKYKEEPPSTYLVQLQVQMWCTDLKTGYLAILSTDLSQQGRQKFPNWPIVIYKVNRSDKLCKTIESEAARFFETRKEQEKYRCNSTIKRQCATLLHMSYEKVFPIEQLDKLLEGSKTVGTASNNDRDKVANKLKELLK
jgi:putative phage-type endonuclease